MVTIQRVVAKARGVAPGLALYVLGNLVEIVAPRRWNLEKDDLVAWFAPGCCIKPEHMVDALLNSGSPIFEALEYHPVLDAYYEVFDITINGYHSQGIALPWSKPWTVQRTPHGFDEAVWLADGLDQNLLDGVNIVVGSCLDLLFHSFRRQSSCSVTDKSVRI